jgi:hypothetical protein
MTVEKQSNERWNTPDELRFVDYLVECPKKPDWPGDKTPRQLLVGYIEHAKERTRLKTWGGVDGREVIKYAEEKLKGLHGTRRGKRGSNA